MTYQSGETRLVDDSKGGLRHSYRAIPSTTMALIPEGAFEMGEAEIQTAKPVHTVRWYHVVKWNNARSEKEAAEISESRTEAGIARRVSSEERAGRALSVGQAKWMRGGARVLEVRSLKQALCSRGTYSLPLILGSWKSKRIVPEGCSCFSWLSRLRSLAVAQQG